MIETIIGVVGVFGLGFGLGTAHGVRIGCAEKVEVEVEKVLTEQLEIKVTQRGYDDDEV